MGGVGVLLREVIKPLLISITDTFLQRHDAPIWDVIRTPQFKVEHVAGGRPFRGTDEIPYSVEELAKTVRRSERSVLSSVLRLEKRGKVKEVGVGWQRKEK